MSGTIELLVEVVVSQGEREVSLLRVIGDALSDVELFQNYSIIGDELLWDELPEEGVYKICGHLWSEKDDFGFEIEFEIEQEEMLDRRGFVREVKRMS